MLYSLYSPARCCETTVPWGQRHLPSSPVCQRIVSIDQGQRQHFTAQFHGNIPRGNVNVEGITRSWLVTCLCLTSSSVYEAVGMAPRSSTVNRQPSMSTALIDQPTIITAAYVLINITRRIPDELQRSFCYLASAL